MQKMDYSISWLRLRQIILSLLIMICNVTFAYDFEVDGLCYNIIGGDNVEVTYRSYEGGSYSGTLQIPEVVTYGDHTFHVTAIGYLAFYNCSGLVGELIIPNSVTSIGKMAFCKCTGFTGSLVIPNSVIEIGEWAFAECGFSGTLTLSNSLIWIRESTFQNCNFIGSLSIPNTVATIGDYAFCNCYGLTGTLTLSNSLKTIGNYAFSSCGFTGTLTIPNSVTTIGDNSFGGCNFSELNLGNSVSSIGKSSFCSQFTGSLKIPKSLTSIGEMAFGWNEFTEIVVDSENSIYDSRDNCNAIIETNSNTLIAGCSYSTIPNSVHKIGNHAFWGCDFNSITIPNSVSSIGDGVFGQCPNLEHVFSKIEHPFPINENTFEGHIDFLHIPIGTQSLYEQYPNWIDNFSSIIEDLENTNSQVTSLILSIKATGNGSASYSGDAIRGTTKSYTLNDGTSATITFTPDAGYRIKSLKVNNTAVSATTSYTVTVNANTSVEVEFEAIPPCTLSIKAAGNGAASYDGDVIRETTKSYTVDGGASITVTFNPDEGYRVKSLKVNGSNVAVSSTYKTTISADTKLEVEFEEIPPNTYTLSIKATGNGSATYDGNTIREAKEKYSVVEGTNISVSFSADEGCRIKSLTVNGVSETISDNYEATINADTSIEVEFEEIPVPTYSLTITALGNGSALYDSEEIRETTKSYTVKEGANVAVGFTPDDGYWTTSLKVNGTSIRTVPEYTATIHEDISIEVEFGESPSTIMTDDVTYRVESASEHTIIVTEVNDGLVLEIPERIDYQEEEWIVTGMEEDVLDSHEETAAIVWNPAAPFTGRVSNPNLLLYVTDASYAPANIKNVVVNGNASSITLTDAQGGNNFYCPRVFTAQQITYTHRYGMRTGIGESRGWETIALPFDVQRYSLSGKGEIMPFKNWESGSDPYPFWLYELSAGGFTEADGIKANTPYIISLPNNDKYVADYRLNGRVTFSAENVEVKTSDDIETSTYSDRTFVPNFTVQESNEGYYALNVNSEYDMYQGGENEGSRFILNLRRIHPFEAYMTTTSNTRSIGIFDDMTTAIKGIEVISGEKVVRVYDLSGKLLRVGTSIEVIRQELPAGVYIVNHQKIIIK